MQNNIGDRLAGQFLTGLSFILMPAIFVFAFAVHPNLFAPRMLDAQGLIARAHHADLLHAAHVLVTFAPIPLIALALRFRRVLSGSRSGWWGLIGCVIAVAGAVFLAVDKGALCLTMSAFDTLKEAEFTAAMPAILSLFNRQGWMVLVWGIILLPIGFAIQAVGLLREKSIPRVEAVCFLVGVLLVATPDGMEIINLSAAILMGLGLVPSGIRLIRACARGALAELF
jgi:hypothetical protein